MGIDVDQSRVVTHNPNHAEGVDTEAPNPHFVTVGTHQVACVFRRSDARRHDQDGNPLIYALKGIGGHTMGQSSRSSIWARVPPLVPLCFPGTTFDYVAPVPSSSRVVAELVQYVVTLLQPRHGIFGQLRKTTVAEARTMLAAAMPGAARRDLPGLRDLDRRLGRASPGGRFTMKDVASNFRPIFQPIRSQMGCVRLDGATVLVVDDLLSSGGSMAAACSAVAALGTVDVRGMVLLGPRRR
jgi:hypothetical protein